MKERPILYSAPMVRAILAGKKTMTRRVIKPQPIWVADPHVPFRTNDADPDGIIPCPYGKPEDRLWVREAFRFAASLDRHSPKNVGIKCLDAGYKTPWAPTQYEADGARKGSWDGFNTPPVITTPGKLRPSMFMPRWASRITLEITGVRVERLNDISEEDARAEGCSGGHDSIPDYPYSATPNEHFLWIWESINGAGSWNSNPWVWVVEFKRVF